MFLFTFVICFLSLNLIQTTKHIILPPGIGTHCFKALNDCNWYPEKGLVIIGLFTYISASYCILDSFVILELPFHAGGLWSISDSFSPLRWISSVLLTELPNKSQGEEGKTKKSQGKEGKTQFKIETRLVGITFRQFSCFLLSLLIIHKCFQRPFSLYIFIFFSRWIWTCDICI